MTIDLGSLVTVGLDQVRRAEKFRPQERKKPLRDMVR